MAHHQQRVSVKLVCGTGELQDQGLVLTSKKTAGVPFTLLSKKHFFFLKKLLSSYFVLFCFGFCHFHLCCHCNGNVDAEQFAFGLRFF